MPIRYTQSTFLSADGHTNIAYTVLEHAQIPPVAVVQIVHGMCEYFGRYMDFARFLCQQGFVVCGNDHLGHGQSIHREAEKGYFGQRDGAAHLVEDVHTLTGLMRQRYADLPVFLLGHSMGSLIARNLLPLYGQEYAGVILSGTPGPNRMATAGYHIALSVGYRKGPLYRSQRLQQLVFGGYNKQIKACKTEFDWLTRDAAVVEKYVSDEKCHFIFTAAGFGVLFRLMENAQKKQAFCGAPADLPLLLIAGKEDPVGQYGSGVERVLCAYRRCGVRDAQIKLYPGARHEVLNETDHQQAYDDLVAWLRRHLPPAASGAAQQE